MDNRDIRYRIVLDRSDVYQTVDDVEKAAARIANSMNGLSSTMLGNAAGQGMAGMGMGTAYGGAMGPAILASQARMYGGYSPFGAMAQDAYQQQVMMAGGAGLGAMGPSFTGPGGLASINPFRMNPAGPYGVPVDYLREFGPTGSPGDVRRGGLFGLREGSFFDMARMGLGMSLWGGIGNDNLEDRMFRNLERRSDRFATNMANLGMWAQTELSMGLGGAALGSFGGAPGALIGGTVGTVGGMFANEAMHRLARPYQDMTEAFSLYTAPYVRGGRIGGGLGMQERMQSMREIARVVNQDNFFTTREYKDLINVAGETGLFQFTRDKDQAIGAIKRVSESVKSLFAIGVAARDQLATIDTLLSSAGISALNPQMLANTMQTMAISAQSAGMGTANLTQLAGQGAQLFAAQGLGMGFGFRQTAFNLASAGAMFRQGALGPEAYAYYGGPQGLAATLGQAQAAMDRTPLGQTALVSMFGNPRNMAALMSGQGIGFDAMMAGAGNLASDPFMFRFIQQRMPFLTQNAGPNLQLGMQQTYIDLFRKMFPQYGNSPERYSSFLTSVVGLPVDQANAMYDQLAGARTTAGDLRRSAADQLAIARMEQLRNPTLGRQITKWFERGFGQPAADFVSWRQEGASRLANSWTEALTGVHRFEYDQLGLLANQPGGYELASESANARLRAAGLSPATGRLDVTAAGSNTAYDTAQVYALRQITESPLMERQFKQAAGKYKGDAEIYLRELRAGRSPLNMDPETKRALDDVGVNLINDRIRDVGTNVMFYSGWRGASLGNSEEVAMGRTAFERLQSGAGGIGKLADLVRRSEDHGIEGIRNALADVMADKIGTGFRGLSERDQVRLGAAMNYLSRAGGRVADPAGRGALERLGENLKNPRGHPEMVTEKMSRDRKAAIDAMRGANPDLANALRSGNPTDELHASELGANMIVSGLLKKSTSRADFERHVTEAGLGDTDVARKALAAMDSGIPLHKAWEDADRAVTSGLDAAGGNRAQLQQGYSNIIHGTERPTETAPLIGAGIGLGGGIIGGAIAGAVWGGLTAGPLGILPGAGIGALYAGVGGTAAGVLGGFAVHAQAGALQGPGNSVAQLIGQGKHLRQTLDIDAARKKYMVTQALSAGDITDIITRAGLSGAAEQDVRRRLEALGGGDGRAVGDIAGFLADQKDPTAKLLREKLGLSAGHMESLVNISRAVSEGVEGVKKISDSDLTALFGGQAEQAKKLIDTSPGSAIKVLSGALGGSLARDLKRAAGLAAAGGGLGGSAGGVQGAEQLAGAQKAFDQLNLTAANLEKLSQGFDFTAMKNFADAMDKFGSQTGTAKNLDDSVKALTRLLDGKHEIVLDVKDMHINQRDANKLAKMGRGY